MLNLIFILIFPSNINPHRILIKTHCDYDSEPNAFEIEANLLAEETIRPSLTEKHHPTFLVLCALKPSMMSKGKGWCSLISTKA